MQDSYIPCEEFSKEQSSVRRARQRHRPGGIRNFSFRKSNLAGERRLPESRGHVVTGLTIPDVDVNIYGTGGKIGELREESAGRETGFVECLSNIRAKDAISSLREMTAAFTRAAPNLDRTHPRAECAAWKDDPALDGDGKIE